MEGATELRVIPYLMEANGIAWGPRGDPVVHIAPNNGADQLLKRGVIESELAASGLEALGVVIDANGDAVRRWSQIRDRCSNEFDGLPDEIPENGLEVDHRDGPRFGCRSHIDSSCGTFAWKCHHVAGDDDLLTIGLGEQRPRLVEA